MAKKSGKAAEPVVESEEQAAARLQRREEQLSSARKLALAIAEAGLDRKALNVEIIDVAGKVDYADFVIVMSGRSDRQVSALAKNVQDDVKKKTGQRCLSVEGLPQAAWVLMDFGDVIVHIFHEDTRGYYDLESLWMDAPRVSTPD
ncbi:MAG: ribosome silencing factor [Sandaracinaceae bacterium]|nr:MAG: ribosome silencing factor [Sandaracinaceae bacterium]HBQ19459.1 ribosome silencing factor [Myxococcales bacterium]